MLTLLNVGFEMAKSGYPWETEPPGYDLDE